MVNRVGRLFIAPLAVPCGPGPRKVRRHALDSVDARRKPHRAVLHSTPFKIRAHFQACVNQIRAARTTRKRPRMMIVLRSGSCLLASELIFRIGDA
jgi:hypothetical protein